MVPPDSHGISRVPCYLGKHSRVTVLRLQGYNPLRLNIPEDSTSTVIDNSPDPRHWIPNAPTTPHTQRTPAITRTWFSLIRFRSPLLTESQLFSLPAGTEMFHFPAFPPTSLSIQLAATPHDGCQVTPFGNPRINVWLPTPRGISQAPTSFIGS